MHGFGFGPSRRRDSLNRGWSHDWKAAGANPAGTSFTRSGSGRYLDASGLLAVAAADAARFPYASGVRLGLLMEPSASNLALASGAIGNGTSWTNVLGATATLNDSVAPDGATSMSKLNCAGTAGYVRQGTAGATFTVGQSYTASCYLKAGTISNVAITAHDSSTYFRVFYNLTGGAVNGVDTGSGAIVSSGIEFVGNGVYRAWFTFLATATGIGSYTFQTNGAADSATRALAAWTGYYHAWGFQCEPGSSPTSYVPTTSWIVTRAADSLKATLSTVIPLFDATKGTFWLEGDAIIGGSAERTLFSAYKASDPTNERIKAYCSGGNVIFEIKAGGVAQASISVARTRAFKAAMRFAANDAQLCVGGTLGIADTSVTLPSGLDSLALGCGASAGVELGGILARLGYAAAAYSDAQLQGLTA